MLYSDDVWNVVCDVWTYVLSSVSANAERNKNVFVASSLMLLFGFGMGMLDSFQMYGMMLVLIDNVYNCMILYDASS